MTDATLLVNPLIKIDGSTLPDHAQIEQIVVEMSLHLPSVATMIFHDPQLEWLDSATLEPGKAITITIQNNKPLFDGEIVEVEADLSADGHRVFVRAFDRLHRLARGAHSRAFTQVSDSDIVTTCAGDVGMQSEIDATSGQHAYFIQANETDLAMLQRRAAANGYLLYANGQKLCFKAPAGATTVELDLSVDLMTFRPRISAAGYIEKTSVRGWDPKQKQVVVGESRQTKIVPKVGLTAKDYLNLRPTGRAANLAIQDQNEAKLLAQGLTDAQISRFIEAEGVSVGAPGLKAGVSVTIKGVGTRFSGTYFVTSATHRLDAGFYTTEFSATGLNAASVLGMLNAPEAAPQPLGGMTIGIVTDNKDPEHLGRVKLKLPLLLDEKTSAEMTTDWARISSSNAGGGRGMLFLPEINDEVLVGFGQGDINLPFVLGVLWNGRDKAPGDKGKMVGGDGKVNQRVIYSRTGHYIMLDDSDADGGISVVDKKGNKIVLKAQDDSLTIETAGDITVTTKGNLSMDVTGDAAFKAKGNITMEATGNLSLKATGNLTAEATGQADVKGTGGAKLESSAIVTVQGSMINLN
ncbi:VgrG-related protein [Oscillochloris sp. ZM17-4]|uniref:VgrG-related protein n=1 Tax=Oscillochloris sp. ZM17-4 TaxID=2866714 RepID=UPI001C73231E|nr:VgrG-related protein [Oscillochloris sp. ZM17-4]MBX0331258.1 VgrG-related protein [Oscillochloris sp. ZM17-4]